MHRLSIVARLKVLIVLLLLGLLLAGCAAATSPMPVAVATQSSSSPLASVMLTPSPSATITPASPSATSYATLTATPARRATDTPTGKPSPSVTLTPTVPPSATPSPSATASPTASPSVTLTPTAPPSVTPSPSATVSPIASPTLTAAPQTVSGVEGESILARNQVIGDYGRGFSYGNEHDDSLKQLGHTGFFRSAQEYLAGNDLREGILSRAAQLDAPNGPELGAIPAIYIIYQGAISAANASGQDFLLSALAVHEYIGGADFDATHMDPFLPQNLGRPFLIFLDHQLGYGGSTPVTNAIKGMLPLLDKYPNLHFFVDPEFRVTDEHKASIPDGELLSPGMPVGHVDAADVNQAQRLIQAYVAEHGLAAWRQEQGGTAEVILGIHQFQDLNVWKDKPYADKVTMIVDKEKIERVPGVTVVFDYDGVGAAIWGGARVKHERYWQTMDPTAYPLLQQGAYPAIKVFPPNELLAPERYDDYAFTLPQLAGQEPIPGVGRFGLAGDDVAPLPRVIIIT